MVPPHMRIRRFEREIMTSGLNPGEDQSLIFRVTKIGYSMSTPHNLLMSPSLLHTSTLQDQNSWHHSNSHFRCEEQLLTIKQALFSDPKAKEANNPRSRAR